MLFLGKVVENREIDHAIWMALSLIQEVKNGGWAWRGIGMVLSLTQEVKNGERAWRGIGSR